MPADAAGLPPRPSNKFLARGLSPPRREIERPARWTLPEKKFRQKSSRAGNSGAPHALAERRRPNTYQRRPYPVGPRLSQTQDVEAQSVSMPIFQAGRVAGVTEFLANAAYDAAWMEAICFQACGPLAQKKVCSGNRILSHCTCSPLIGVKRPHR